VLYIVLKMNFSLIQPRCQISKRLYGESKPCDYLRTAPSRQIITNSYQPSGGVTALCYVMFCTALYCSVLYCYTSKKNAKINHLPLMIFIWLHSQDYHLLNKCLFHSIKSLFISKKPPKKRFVQ
jgi:hypothetical protein